MRALSCMRKIVINSPQGAFQIFELRVDCYACAVHLLVDRAALVCTHRWLHACSIHWMVQLSIVVDFCKVLLQHCNCFVDFRVSLSQDFQGLKGCCNYTPDVAQGLCSTRTVRLETLPSAIKCLHHSTKLRPALAYLESLETSIMRHKRIK